MGRILVVDDEPDIVELIVRLLAKDHHVSCAYSAAEALAMIDDCDPGVAIVDVAMPGMDGLELVRSIRGRETTRRLPVVFLSARVLPADIEAGLTLGDEYLTKPCRGDVLREVVDRLLAAGTGASP